MINRLMAGMGNSLVIGNAGGHDGSRNLLLGTAVG